MRVPGAAQREVMRCRPGSFANAMLGKIPDRRRTASRCVASGIRVKAVAFSAPAKMH
jgi:hypothetical protein